ncbi:MAG: hypothetical protein KJ760_19995, partial [Proteobacteria bacterium]|nr:hypothetical protein [Pseudomonadota bacterium]
GVNPIWLWLQDNVGNADPSTAVPLSLRYDDIPPASTASAPAASGENTVTVTFASSDEGAAGVNPTGSGVSKTVLWSGYPSVWCRWITPGPYYERYYCAHDGPVQWSSSSYVSTGVSGVFAFDTDKEGDWYFYTQAYDAAGNAEPVPVSTTPAKAATFVDATAPVISKVKASAFSPDTAVIEWTTDDETAAVIDYGRTASLGSQFTETTSSRTHSVTLTGLPNPADIYYKITATNRTGLATASDVGFFKTPLNISYTTDIFGVIDYDEPVTLFITNPDINLATLVIDGQTWSGTVNTSEPIQIYVDPALTGGGTQAINVTADGYEYSSNFVVDTAVRSVKLARLVISDGGVMTSTAVIPGDYVADMTAGQEMQGEMSNGESRLYLGYYAGIDPVAPAAIGDLAATPGPEAGQMSLAWTAPGDDANVGTAMKYEIRYSTEPITVGNFASAALAADIPLPQPAGTAQTHVVSGLENGKTYYFAIMAMDELPNQSLSNTASAKTLEVAQSEAQIGGKPAVKVVSKTPDLNIAQVPAESQEAAALASRGAAPGQGLVFFSDIYEITPSMQLTEGATVQFGYEDLGTDVERELAVYKYNPALSQWVMLAGAVDADNNVITAVTYSFSLFAVFARDTKSPTTEIVFEEGSTYRDDFDDIYISSRTLLGFKAEDPTLGGKPGSGVKETGYRIDSSTTPFITFTAAFPPGEGFHGVQYRSVDNAGNAEQTKQSGIRVDASAPVIGFRVDKTTITLRDKMIVPAVSCALTVTVFDPSIKGAASGVRYASVAVNGENVPAGGAGFVKQLAGGAYHVAASAEDHLGNKAENEIDILVVPDALAPRSGLGIVGTAYRAGGIEYVTGKASFTLTSVDDLITPGDGAGGVKKQNVKIRDAENIKREESFENPKPEQGGIFSSTFSLAAWGLADGAYYLDYNAEDMLGNIETVRRSSVALDNL